MIELRFLCSFEKLEIMLHVKASGIEIQFFSALGSKIRYGLSCAIQHLVQSPNFKNLVQICASILECFFRPRLSDPKFDGISKF